MRFTAQITGQYCLGSVFYMYYISLSAFLLYIYMQSQDFLELILLEIVEKIICNSRIRKFWPNKRTCALQTFLSPI